MQYVLGSTLKNIVLIDYGQKWAIAFDEKIGINLLAIQGPFKLVNDLNIPWKAKRLMPFFLPKAIAPICTYTRGFASCTTFGRAF